MSEIKDFSIRPEQFADRQKTKFFANLAASTSSAFKQHIKEDLWVRNAKGERDWGNVSEHCLVEVARVGSLADMIGLSSPIMKELEIAAGLHDVHKKQQIEFVTQHGLNYTNFDLAARRSYQGLIDSGFSEPIAIVAGSVGHESLHEIEPIVDKKELTGFDKARLIMHYVDDYTVNADWARPKDAKGNDLDRRMANNEANERYRVLNEEGKKHFNGETAYQAQRRVGHRVEVRLSQLIEERTEKKVDPLDLPEFVDADIKSRISQIKSNSQ